MEYETPLGRGLGGEIASSPEAAHSYAEFGHAELIGLYYDTEGDSGIGTALSERLFRHAGVTLDPRVVPLIGRDGVQVEAEGKPLMLSDYVNYAAGHHFEALEGILGFLMCMPGAPDYETTRATIMGRLGANRL